MPEVKALPSYLYDHRKEAVRCGEAWLHTSHGMPRSRTGLQAGDDLASAHLLDEYYERVGEAGTTDRANVAAMMKERPALGVVASMVWGLAPIQRRNPFRALLRLDEFEIERRVDRALTLMDGDGSDHLDAAHRAMGAGGDAKLPGLGEAFYTKVLHFLGIAHEVGVPRPLIFDQHTKRAYYVLLRETGDAAETGRFTGRVSDPNGSPFPAARAGSYAAYCGDMNSWARQVWGTQASDDSASALEAFVFGYSGDPRYQPSDLCGGLNPRADLEHRFTRYREQAADPLRLHA